MINGGPANCATAGTAERAETPAQKAAEDRESPSRKKPEFLN